VKKFFISRLEAIKNKHRTIHSDVTIKNMSRCWARVLNLFGNLSDLDMGINHPMWTVENVVEKVQSATAATPHEIIDIYHLFTDFNEEWNGLSLKQFKAKFSAKKADKKEKGASSLEIILHDNNNDKDKHRLTSKQQEDIMAACQTPFECLIISLLFSTGLRVSGLRNIRLSDVCEQTTSSDQVSVLDFGRTVEKGNKVRNFPLVPMVKEPLQKWVSLNSSLKSPFLFPSTRNPNSPLSVLIFQNAFKEIAKRAGHSGPEIHIHAARHSVAFNLLESGNSMDKIGKFLGHANPATTAKFYAKMSTQETVARMNTACIGGEDKISSHKPDVPNFNRRSKRRRKNHLSSLKDISIVIQ
jgi:integrase